MPFGIGRLASRGQRPSQGIPIPVMAGWALGFGVATIVASLLVWALSGLLPPHRALAAAIIIILVLLAFVLGQLAVVFGMRSQWQVAQSPKPMAGAATLDQLCGIPTRSAAELLVEVGDPRRFTDGGFARFNGTAPLPASGRRR